MDFAWVVDALRRGLKVTREAWKQDPPVKYIYMITGENGKRAIMMSVLSGSDSDFEWYPNAEQLLTVTDWEEYGELKVDGSHHTGDTMTVEEYQRMHSGEKRMPAQRQEGPFVINPLPLTGTMGMHGGKPVDELDIDAETNKAIALVARNIAENLVELLRNPSVLRLLQKTDVPLSKEDTNHV